MKKPKIAKAKYDIGHNLKLPLEKGQERRKSAEVVEIQVRGLKVQYRLRTPDGQFRLVEEAKL